jgi:protein tyrosine/serine phosphatase
MNKKLIKEIEFIANKYNINIIKDDNGELSEKFIKEFENKVDWDCISICQELSEEFIEKFQNKIDWQFISWYQKLNEKFIRKHLNKLNIKHILKHRKLSNNFKDFLKTYYE